MASILDKYGIKEVADIMFYTINESSGEPDKPVLYIDTAKVFTTETTAENTSARGGKGNPELITWDFNKEINVTLEDALFSMKSMAVMFGESVVESTQDKSVKKTMVFTGTKPSTWIDVTDTTNVEHTIPTSAVIYNINGEVVTSPSDGVTYFLVFNIDEDTDGVKSQTITVNSDSFPGTYYVTGDTFARNYITGKDDYFQIIFPKAKILSENTITTQADGDPSTFSMNLKVLRSKSGAMMKLIKYDVR